MKESYDVVMYFYWAHPHIVHKYLSLHNKLLENNCSVMTILGKGEFGIDEDHFLLFDEKYRKDVYLQSMEDALETLQKVDYKVAVLSSNGRKGFVNEDGHEPPPLGARAPNIGKDVKIAKDKGAKTIQISEMITDFYYAGADIASLVSPHMRELHINSKHYSLYHRYQWRPFNANPEPEYIYSNCLLWDNTDDCLPPMPKEEFCEKYDLDPNKEIFVWLPTMPQSMSQEAYKKVCQLDNVIIKLHPNEYRRLAANRHDHKWSYEICGIENPRILDPIDTHWCYKYAACVIGCKTSASIEMPLYNTPFLYVGSRGFTWSNLFHKFGHRCDISELDEFIRQKKYNNKISEIEDYYYKRILMDPDKSSAELLTEQITGFIK